MFALAAIAGVALACSSGSSSPKVECQPAEGPVTHGPRAGAVTESTAKIWVRGCSAADVNVQYKAPGETSWGQIDSAATKTDLGKDGTAIVELTGLQPNTAYTFRVAVDGQAEDSLSGSFQTMPSADQPGVMSFVFGADIRPEGSRAVFSTLLQQKPAFAIFYGDQIYVDPQLPPEEPHFDVHGKQDYEAVYRNAWAEPAFAKFIANTSTFLMWDDHEILNDWDKQDASPFQWALPAYQEYQGSANPEPYRPGVLYYVVRAGPAELFVLDERSYRSANDQRDDQLKTMLGIGQKADLETWLLNSTAKFKFIVSPVMWSDFAKHTEEAWPSFSHERNEILDYVRDHHVPGVILLSGDEHWTVVLRLTPWGLYELAPTPLAGFSGVAAEENSPEILFKLGQAAVFGSITIDTATCPATLDFQVVDAFGKVRYELPLTEADLVQPPVAAVDYCAASQQGRLDSDGDGCADALELGNDERQGGRRDPFGRWDFYDVTGDQQVDSRDALAVTDALGTRIGSRAYDPSFDRSAPVEGADPWDARPPDGIIDDIDFFLVTAQVGTSCAQAPAS